jgi:5'-nucleotidase
MFKLRASLVIVISLLSISSLMGSYDSEQWPKRVLITNDNGIDDIKIIKLSREFAKIAETYIVAPSKDRSGATNYALSLKEGKISVVRKNIDKNVEAFAVEGYPADCILVGLAGIMRDDPPDLVVSGINGGPNLAFEWIGSGTIGAARMASLSVPAIAVSGLDDSIPGAVEDVAAWVVEFAQSELVRNLEKNQYLTISVPTIPFDQIKGVRLAKRAGMNVDFRFMNDEKDSRLWVMRPVPLETELSKESDLYLYNAGYIAVVPMKLDEHDYELYDRIKLNPQMLKQIQK